MNNQLLNWLRGPDRPADNAEATAAFNADTSLWRDVPLSGLTAKLRTAGLLRKLKAIIADANTPQELAAGLADFVDHVEDGRQQHLSVASDPEVAARTQMLLAALAQHPAVTPGDLQLIREQIRGGPDATTQEVDETRLYLLRESEGNTPVTAGQTSYERVRAWRDRYANFGDVPVPPTLNVDAPVGFAFDVETGALLPVGGA